MSQITKNNSGGSGSNLELVGDVGTATGPIITQTANTTSGSSVLFFNSGSSSELVVTDINHNTIIGASSGNGTLTGTDNTHVGYSSLVTLTSGQNNTSIGSQNARALTSGNNNTLLGAGTLLNVTTGSNNSVVGSVAMQNLTTGNNNCGLGYLISQQIVNGSFNVFIGNTPGSAYTSSESSNIILQNPGVVGDSNTMRLGLTGNGNGRVTRAFMAATNGVSVSNPVMVVMDSSTEQLGTLPVPAGLVSGSYGDGSDGSQTFDGTTTVLGLVPSANTYTLTRDIFLSVGSINSGVTIITNACRIFCRGTLTNNGIIQWNGNNGTGSVRGATLQNVNGTITTALCGHQGGLSTITNGTAGVAATVSLGGAGGISGIGALGTAGAGGTSTPPPASTSTLRFVPNAIQGRMTAATNAFQTPDAGAGGGGGGGDGTLTGGFGGGGAGFVIVVSFQFAGTGMIQANGGNGGNGNTSATGTGGGGGGGGGIISIVSNSIISGAIAGQTIQVNGGTGGTGSGTGGTNGSSGSPGNIYLVTN